MASHQELLMISYGKQKHEAGSFAAFVWIISGIYLFWSREELAFFSWNAIVFFVFGMFVAALAFGFILYGAQRLVGKILLRVATGPSERLGAIISLIGVVLYGATAVLIFFAAREFAGGLAQA
jgi:hypothetical protein